MRTLLVIISLTVVATPAAVQAQTLDGRARITRSCDCPVVTGTLVETSQEQLTLEVAGSDSPLVLDMADVTRIEVAVGQGSYAGRGALIGLGVAVTAGLLTATSAEDDFLFTPAQQGGIVGVMVGLFTVPIGALAGWGYKKTTWEAAALPGTTVELGLAPTTQGGLAFGGSIRF